MNIKKIFMLLYIFIFYQCCESQSAALELRSLNILNQENQTLQGSKVKAGQKVIVEMVYVQKGFSKTAKIILKISIYDQRGKEILKDRIVHPSEEGAKKELYNLQIPENASGPFLIVLNIKMLENKKVYAKIIKKLPIDIESGGISSS